MKLIAIGGAPSSGKTSLMVSLLKLMHWKNDVKLGLLRAHHFENDIYVLGIYKGEGTFLGTDKLSMAVQKDAEKFLEYVADNPNVKVIFEGDRLFNSKFIEFAQQLGYEVKVFLTEVSEEVFKKRQFERGNKQNPTWLKGRISKSRGVYEKFGGAKQVFLNDDSQQKANNVSVILSELIASA